MNRYIFVLLFLLISFLIFSSEKYKDKINDYVLSFQLQEITYQGIKGFFIPIQGYNILYATLSNFCYLQDQYKISESFNEDLQKKLKYYEPIKTAFGVTLGISITEMLLIACVGILCYNIALK